MFGNTDWDADAWDRAVRGEIPWSADGYRATAKWYQALHRTPKDDWDLKPMEVLFHTSDSSPLVFAFNPLFPDNQLAEYLSRRYPGIDGMSHFMRFIGICEFVEEYRDGLALNDLVQETDGGAEMREEVLRVLCEEKYTRTQINAHGVTLYDFDYDFVVARARERIG